MASSPTLCAVSRVADEVRHGFGVGLEFFARAGVAGDEAFGDAEGAQAAPFVVVAFEPDGGEVGKLAVRGDVGGRQVAVVVVDGLVFGVVVVEGARGVVVQEEVVGQEGHGWLRSNVNLIDTTFSRANIAIF